MPNEEHPAEKNAEHRGQVRTERARAHLWCGDCCLLFLFGGPSSFAVSTREAHARALLCLPREQAIYFGTR